MSARPLALLLVTMVAAGACGGSSDGERLQCRKDLDCPAQSYCGLEKTCVGDDRLPRIALDAPKPGALVTGDSILVKGTIEDDSGVETCKLAVNDGPAFELEPSGRTFSARLELPNADGKSATVSVTATDRAWNEARLSVEFTIDNVGPAARVVSPQGAAFGTDEVGSRPSIEVSLSDGSGVSSAQWSIDGGQNWQEAEAPYNTLRLEAWFEIAPATERVVHELWVRAADPAGNVRVSVLPIVVDTVAPIIALDLPDGTVLNRSAANPYPLMVHQWEASPSTFSWFIDGASHGQMETSGGSGAVPLPLLDSDDYERHRLELTVTDVAGNSGHASLEYLVDRVAPQLRIIDPSADGTCTPSSACIGAVANLATEFVAFSGWAMDRVPEKMSVVASMEGEPLGLRRSDWAWQTEWTPTQADGEHRRFTVTATDEHGNAASASRLVYVDTVRPTARLLVDRPRLTREPPKVEFSEAMDPQSVRRAVRLSGEAPPPSLGTVDGRVFDFGAGFEPVPYTVYELQVDANALDAAGNGALPYSERFLTDGVEPEELPRRTASAPRLAIDADGRPVVLWWNPGASGFHALAWDGRGEWVASEMPFPEDTAGRVGSFRIRSTIGSDLALQPHYEAALVVDTPSGSGAWFAARGPWTSYGWSPQRLGDASAVGLPTLVRGTGRFCEDQQCEQSTEDFVAYLAPSRLALMGRVQEEWNRWSEPLMVMGFVWPAKALRGAGIAAGRIAYVPERTELDPLMALGPATEVEGVQQLEVDGVPVGSAWLAWGSQESFRLACSRQPGQASSWKVGTPARPSAASPVRRIAMAANAEKVAIAIEVGGDVVHFGTFENGDCEEAPLAVTWEQPVEHATQPAVAVSAEGRIFRVTVSSGGTLTWHP